MSARPSYWSVVTSVDILELPVMPVRPEAEQAGKRTRIRNELRYRTFTIRQSLMALVCLVVEVLGVAAILSNPQRATAQAQFASRDNEVAPAVVIGFLGGFVHSNDRRHAEVHIVQQLRETYGNGVRVEIFENRRRAKAHKWILDWLNRKGDGKLTDENKRSTRVILFGHSWGASAVVSLARDLQQDGIPVSLTIQVDSVTKNGEDDSLIPANVAEAVNFYQTGGILHGRSKIRAADLSRTKILGNFRFTYDKEPAECRAYPWYDRLLFKGHTAIECDPRVWSQVEALIRMRLTAALQPAQAQVAARLGN